MHEQMDHEGAQRDDKNESQDEAGELRTKSKMRSNLHSALCASQTRGSMKNSGQFAKKKKSKPAATEVTEALAEDTAVQTFPVFAIKTQLPAAHTHTALSSARLAAFLSELEAAFKDEVQNALKNAVSGLLHGIQSSSADGIQEREEAVQLWQQASASAVASIELMQVPTLHQATLEAARAEHRQAGKPGKRKRVVPSDVSAHKSDRRIAHKSDHHLRDQQRGQVRQRKLSKELALDTHIALELQRKVKEDLHYSERRLMAVSAYFKARSLGMSNRTNLRLVSTI